MLCIHNFLCIVLSYMHKQDNSRMNISRLCLRNSHLSVALTPSINTGQVLSTSRGLIMHCTLLVLVMQSLRTAPISSLLPPIPVKFFLYLLDWLTAGHRDLKSPPWSLFPVSCFHSCFPESEFLKAFCFSQSSFVLWLYAYKMETMKSLRNGQEICVSLPTLKQFDKNKSWL